MCKEINRVRVTVSPKKSIIASGVRVRVQRARAVRPGSRDDVGDGSRGTVLLILLNVFGPT